jgi:hypothetical protein
VEVLCDMFACRKLSTKRMYVNSVSVSSKESLSGSEAISVF